MTSRTTQHTGCTCVEPPAAINNDTHDANCPMRYAAVTHVATSVDTTAITLHAHAARAAIQIARVHGPQAKRAERMAYTCARACATAARRLGLLQQVCENCGRLRPDVTARPHGIAECETCYTDTLAYGLQHVADARRDQTREGE